MPCHAMPCHTCHLMIQPHYATTTKKNSLYTGHHPSLWRRCLPAETADCRHSRYSLSFYWLSQHRRRSHYTDVCPFPPCTCVRLAGRGSRSLPPLQGSVCIPLAHSRSLWPCDGAHLGVGRATRRHQTGGKKWDELAILPMAHCP